MDEDIVPQQHLFLHSLRHYEIFIEIHEKYSLTASQPMFIYLILAKRVCQNYKAFKKRLKLQTRADKHHLAWGSFSKMDDS